MRKRTKKIINVFVAFSLIAAPILCCCFQSTVEAASAYSKANQPDTPAKGSCHAHSQTEDNEKAPEKCECPKIQSTIHSDASYTQKAISGNGQGTHDFFLKARSFSYCHINLFANSPERPPPLFFQDSTPIYLKNATFLI